MKNISDIRQEIKDRTLISKFFFAGKAIITIESKKTGEHFTYKIIQAFDKKLQQKENVWFVKVLTGSCNSSHYTYIGTIFEDKSKYFHSVKSKITPNALSVRVLDWFVTNLSSKVNKLDQCSVWHEGTCARCGRKLTQPESIRTGFGKDCAIIVGVDWI
jgi:hypothetical protein